MFVISFSSCRVTEFSDINQFDQRVKKFVAFREAENSYLISMMNQIRGGTLSARMFIIEDDNLLGAAGLLLNNGGMITSWATPEMMDALIDHAIRAEWKIVEILAPGHCSYLLGKAYAERTRQRFELGRGERVYLLAQNTYDLPSDGKLEVATEADHVTVQKWLKGFIAEANYEGDAPTFELLSKELVTQRLLYFWKNPRPCAMAGWVCPTPNGASINYVYTPPDLRGRGYGKAVTAALAAQMLASGLKYCFIRADSDDVLTNGVYQAIGAHTLCEFVRCRIHPLAQPATPENPRAATFSFNTTASQAR